MALIKILIDTGNESFSELDNLQSRKESLVKVINYLKAVNSGAESAEVKVYKEAVQQVNSITVGGTGVQADETFQVCSETFTFKDLSGNGNTGLWVDINDTSESAVADNIAAVIESTSSLEGVVGAESDGVDTVTITFDEGGEVGRALVVTESATDVTAAQGATGTNGTATTVTSG